MVRGEVSGETTNMSSIDGSGEMHWSQMLSKYIVPVCCVLMTIFIWLPGQLAQKRTSRWPDSCLLCVVVERSVMSAPCSLHALATVATGGYPQTPSGTAPSETCSEHCWACWYAMRRWWSGMLSRGVSEVRTRVRQQGSRLTYCSVGFALPRPPLLLQVYQQRSPARVCHK